MNQSIMRRSHPAVLCLAILLAASARVAGQTLARPGWAGSGMTAQYWFRHAVLYRIDVRSFAHSAADPDTAAGTLKGITEHLDYIRNLGVDAILLEPLTPDLIAGVVAAAPVDPNLGTIDDFDELSLQASKRNLRILVTLPGPGTALARYWLTRGVAGFYIPCSAVLPALQPIRKLLPTFVGQRILITDADLSGGGAPAKSPANELQLDFAVVKLPTQPQTGAATQLRGALEQSQTLVHSGTPMLAIDGPGSPRSIDRFAPAGFRAGAARLLAAVLMLNRSVPVIYAGQELGLASPNAGGMILWGKPPATQAEPAVQAAAASAPTPATPTAPSERYVPYVSPARPTAPTKPAALDPATVAGQDVDANSTLNFYRELIQLHHSRPSVRDGDEILLNLGDANALVLIRKPANPSLSTPPLVVVCNLSAEPLQFSIKSEFTSHNLRGSFLRSVLHTGTESVSMNLNAVSLPPFGVYIGELRY